MYMYSALLYNLSKCTNYVYITYLYMYMYVLWLGYTKNYVQRPIAHTTKILGKVMTTRYT